MHTLNRNALAILAYLRTRAAEPDPIPPSRAEIALACDIASTGTVQRLLRRLETAGYVKLKPGLARAVILTNGHDG